MRRFLFLQGPHGPFFRQLSKMLRKTGADTIRVGFNKGDEIFWGPDNLIAFTQDLTQWTDTFSNIVTKHTITDVVLYGDTRPIHKQAIEIAQARNITIHVFEEGYMRPYWITYERNGSNGNSRLMDMSLADAAGVAIFQSGHAYAPFPLGRYTPAHILWRRLSLVGDVREP